MECIMDNLIEMRTEMNKGLDKSERISVNDFVIEAFGAALTDVSDVTAGWIVEET